MLHFLRNDDPDFTSFGECYMSEINSVAIKGWKKHLEQTQNIVVPIGKIKFVLFDSRNNSATKTSEDSQRLCTQVPKSQKIENK